MSDVIKKIIENLPLSMQPEAKLAVKKYMAEKREKLSPEVVERIYLQVLNEAKARGEK